MHVSNYYTTRVALMNDTGCLRVYIGGHLGRIQKERPALSGRPSPHHFLLLLTASSACSLERTPGGKQRENVGGERERQRGGKGRDGGVKVKLSPLKLVEETASPFWVWSITFAGHLKKGKKRKGKAIAFPQSLSFAAGSTCCFANWTEDRGRQEGGNSREEMETRILALPLLPSLSTLPPPVLLPSPSCFSASPSISYSPPLSFQSSCFPLPCWLSPELPLERDSWHKMSLIISPLSWLCLQDSRREWRSSRPELVLGWQKTHPGHRALGSLGRKLSRGSPHLLSSSLTVLWQSEEEAEIARDYCSLCGLCQLSTKAQHLIGLHRRSRLL